MALSRLPIPLTIGGKRFSLLYFPMKPMAEEVSLKDFMGWWRGQGSKLFGEHRSPAAPGIFSFSLDS
jgi:hypothetical protein